MIYNISAKISDQIEAETEEEALDKFMDDCLYDVDGETIECECIGGGVNMADIELVIKIPEEAYDFIKRTGYHTQSLYEAIKNGTPLPMGHGRLIDADTTIKSICGNNCGCNLEECGRDFPCYSVQRINSALTIIEADTEGET